MHLAAFFMRRSLSAVEVLHAPASLAESDTAGVDEGVPRL